MKEQQRLESIDYRISQATTKRVLRRLRGLLYNTSNWHLTPEQYAYKHELLKNVNERLITAKLLVGEIEVLQILRDNIRLGRL